MPVAVFDGYYFVFRERALTAFLILANHGLVLGNASQVPDFVDRNSGLVPLVLSAFDVDFELQGRMPMMGFFYRFSFHFSSRHKPPTINAGLGAIFVRKSVDLAGWDWQSIPARL